MAPSTPEGHLYVDGSQKYALVADLKAIALQADAVARRTRTAAVNQATAAAESQVSPLASRVATLARELEGFVATTDKIVVGGLEFKQAPEDPLLYVPVEGNNVSIDGSVVEITGAKPTAANLPSSGVQGQAYAVLDSGHLYVWGINAWVDVGPFRGPQGDPGETGPPPQLSIGEVSVAGEGETPGVFLSGNALTPVLDFMLPAPKQGEPGLPGVKAVENDTAIAGYINSTMSETRAAINSLLTKDTGWRALDITSGTARIRRVDAVVELAIANYRPPITGTNVLLQLPGGFRPTNTTPSAAQENNTLRIAQALSYSPFDVQVLSVSTANSYLTASILFTTTNAWPTNLPGTAI